MDRSDADRLIAGIFKPACTTCGETDWRVFGKSIDANPTRLVLGAAWPDGTAVEDYGFEILAFACVQCGTIRLMAPDPPDLDLNAEAEPH